MTPRGNIISNFVETLFKTFGKSKFKQKKMIFSELCYIKVECWKREIQTVYQDNEILKANNSTSYTAQKMKFSIKDFFSKCDQIRRKLSIWSHLLRKSLIENLIFCAVLCQKSYNCVLHHLLSNVQLQLSIT